ncbi:hypothetical protein [Patulibacter minatonensis]|uniref:hypothetical protein n=1 Tax=Patulibacter minatonensis TaxID=298163 RepID=UPI0004786B5C|nr:hypothetical protein [Patulibacter minatonensis]
MMRPALPLLATAVLLAGCGGGDDDPTTEARSPSTTTAPATTAATTPTTTAATPAAEIESAPAGSAAQEKATARDGVLVRADLPGTWTGGQVGGKDEVDGPCPAIVAAKRATSGRARTELFRKGDSSVGSAVYLYETPAQALRSLESINSDFNRDCIVKAGLDQVRDAAKKAGGTVSAPQESTPALTGGSGPSAYRVSVTVRAEGRTEDVSISIATSRVGRGLALLALVGVDDAVQQQLMTAAVRRLTDAQAVGP